MYVQTAITIFNKRLSTDRREVYFPTYIDGASFYEAKNSEHSTDGVHSEQLSYKLRIPIDAKIQGARTYVGEKAYKAMPADDVGQHWTIQKGDIVLPHEVDLAGPVDEAWIKQLAADHLVDVITVKEYADNTIRGSAAVKHWRIGGE